MAERMNEKTLKHLEALKKRHVELDNMIAEEMAHPLPDDIKIQEYKKQKLLLGKKRMAIALGLVFIIATAFLYANAALMQASSEVTNLTKELEDEGFVREMISKIQTMRKEADFNVTDHIRLSICGGEDLYRVVRENESEICGQVLADELVLEKAEGFVKNWNINGMKADIGVERL